MTAKQVVFLCLGTRGDVQPILCVASALSQHPHIQCTLVTHAALQEPLTPFLGQVSFFPIQSPSYQRDVIPSDILGYEEEEDEEKTSLDALLEQDNSAELHNELPVTHATDADMTPLNDPNNPNEVEETATYVLEHDIKKKRQASTSLVSQDDKKHQSTTRRHKASDRPANSERKERERTFRIDRERQACLEACMEGKADLIVFNLFTLCAWHIAECLNVPSLCLHPYLIPSVSIYAYMYLSRCLPTIFLSFEIICNTLSLCSQPYLSLMPSVHIEFNLSLPALSLSPLASL